MSSGGHRGFTVVTIMTLIFAPVFSHKHWMYQLVSHTTATQTVACVVHEPCPAHKVVVNVVKPPLPPDPPKGEKNREDHGHGG